MRILAVLAVALLSTAVLAGCSDDSNGDEPSSSTSSTSRSTTSATASSSSRSSTTSSSSTSTAPANSPPSGSISAVAGSGALPVRVNFTLSGSDPDGDVIVWDLAFGDSAAANGTVLPATVAHNYTAAGNYTAVFTITDGKESATYDVAVAVTAGGSAGFTAVFSEAQSAPSNPAMSAGDPSVGFAGAIACAGFHAGMSGIDCVFFELDPALEGHAYTITSDVGDPDFEFWGTCSIDPTGLPDTIFAIDGAVTEGPEAGIMPAGVGCAVIWNKLGPDTPTHTLTII